MCEKGGKNNNESKSWKKCELKEKINYSTYNIPKDREYEANVYKNV